jgi:hypothetical protein
LLPVPVKAPHHNCICDENDNPIDLEKKGRW